MGAMRGGGVPPQKSKDCARPAPLLERLRPERTKLAMAIASGHVGRFMVSGRDPRNATKRAL